MGGVPCNLYRNELFEVELRVSHYSYRIPGLLHAACSRNRLVRRLRSHGQVVQFMNVTVTFVVLNYYLFWGELDFAKIEGAKKIVLH